LYDNLGNDEACALAVDAIIRHRKKDSCKGSMFKEWAVLFGIQEVLQDDDLGAQIFELAKIRMSIEEKRQITVNSLVVDVVRKNIKKSASRRLPVGLAYQSCCAPAGRRRGHAPPHHLPVMATWYIRSQNWQLCLPLSSISLPYGTRWRRRKRILLAASEKKPHFYENTRLSITEYAQGSQVRDVLEVFQWHLHK
jgi:hypothetical protein